MKSKLSLLQLSNVALAQREMDVCRFSGCKCSCEHWSEDASSYQWDKNCD